MFRTALLCLIAACGSTCLAADIAFEKRTLTERFVAEGCDMADFDKDGHVDITAGNTIWHGPDFKRQTEFTPPANNPAGPTKTPYDPAKGYSDYFLAYAHDFTGDTWPDILVFGLPGEAAHVFVNPQGKAGHWEKHAIFDVADGESPDLKDMNGDGKPELIAHSAGQLGFAEIDWSKPLGKARFRPVTPKSPENDKKYFRYTHGYGAGDVNGDGRIDLLTKDGWFEQPADISTDTIWPFRPGPFGPKDAPRGGAHMYAYDVNGDGRNDVITSYDGHGFGLGWFERNANGTFTERKIMGATPEENAQGVKFSQPHALRLVDMNGDGLLDIVTGKRRWAHGISGDAEPNAAPVLYWFELVRDGKGGATYVAHQIDDDSGVGTQVTVGDLDKDGKPDVIVANKRGVFAFSQRAGTAAIAADPWLVIEGGEGPGKGKHVVLVSGDEEYRSEEALTQLAKILAKHHGITCTVLYAIDPATGEINPNKTDNIPGLEALRKADLMVIATRFRNLPDEQMQEIDAYLKAGKPVIGMRTATHAFNIPKDRAYAHYGNGYAGDKTGWIDGFGRLVLGEKWISHHGHHGSESTRGLVVPEARDHPILRGIKDGDIWGPTDVYGVRLPLPGDAQPLVVGQVLEGMTPDSPVVTGADAKKNEPMMPIAWTKTYAIDGGPKGRVFTTTMGSSTDLSSAGMRRLLVNACYWALGMESRIPNATNVDIVGTYEPTKFGFNGAKKGLKPSDL